MRLIIRISSHVYGARKRDVRLFANVFLVLIISANGISTTYGQRKPVVSSTLGQSTDLVRYVKPRCPTGVHVPQPVVVQLNAVIKTDGAVKDIEFVTGDSRFRREALRAVRTWKYRPVVVRGTPTDIKTEFQLTFECP
jgi:hypothetical protein